MIKLIDERKVSTNKGIIAHCDVDTDRDDYIKIIKDMDDIFLITCAQGDEICSIGLKKENLLALLEIIKNNIDNMV